MHQENLDGIWYYKQSDIIPLYAFKYRLNGILPSPNFNSEGFKLSTAMGFVVNEIECKFVHIHMKFIK